MRAIKLFVLLTTALATSACAGEESPFYAYKDPSDAPEPIRTAAKAVVRISTPWSNATGSFLSADGMLLTNNHVLGVEVCPREGCFAKLSLSYERGHPFQSSVQVFVQPLHVDVGLDMAVVQVFSVDASGKPGNKLKAPHALTLSARDAPSLVATHVNVVGHPQGALKKWSEGEVVDADGLWFRDSATSLPGNSGSPILDDEGRIVGLLHRGTRDPGLITADGANLYSIGTASAALAAALDDALPDTVLSLAAPATADEVVARQELYFNARVTTAALDTGMTKDVLVLLGEACDKGLLREDYVSPEDLRAGLEPCYNAQWWITCASDAPAGTFGVCPVGVENGAWQARFQGAFEKQRAFNGDLWLDMVSFAQASLAASQLEGRTAGRASLSSALDEARPPLSFSLGPYLGAFEVQSYGGKTLVSYLTAYKEVPHYELSARSIVYTALWLENRDFITSDKASSLLSDLAGDDKLDLNDKLLVEAKRYERGALE